MAQTHSYLFQVATNVGSESIASQLVVTDAIAFDLDIALTSGQAVTEVPNVPLKTNTSRVGSGGITTLAGNQIRSLVLQNIGPGELTIYTNNNTGAGTDTVVMTPGQILFWRPAFIDVNAVTWPLFGVNPFPTVDVTELWVKQSTGTVGATSLKLRAILINP